LSETADNNIKDNMPKDVDLQDIDLLAYALNRLYSESNQKWLAEIRPYGLTTPRWQVLSILVPFDGSRIGTIADLSGTDQPILSRVIDQMQRDDLVERRASITDSRAVELWITSKGRELHKRLMPSASQYIEEMTHNFTDQEKTQLMSFMTRLLNNIKD
jgi:DNA-binding MarR family transcriptional regulator